MAELQAWESDVRKRNEALEEKLASERVSRAVAEGEVAA